MALLPWVVDGASDLLGLVYQTPGPVLIFWYEPPRQAR
jgi:hypothetical protein